MAMRTTKRKRMHRGTATDVDGDPIVDVEVVGGGMDAGLDLDVLIDVMVSVDGMLDPLDERLEVGKTVTGGRNERRRVGVVLDVVLAVGMDVVLDVGMDVVLDPWPGAMHRSPRRPAAQKEGDDDSSGIGRGGGQSLPRRGAGRYPGSNGQG